MRGAHSFLAVFLVVGLAAPAAATPFVPDFSGGPIVFDFEDGLQGWTANGSAQRVGTQVLGGQWAIFGDGDDPDGASIRLEIDLTNVSAIQLEQFYSSGEESADFLGLSICRSSTGSIFCNIGNWTTSPDPSANPGIRTLDVESLSGIWDVGILWRIIFVPAPADGLQGFVDNITLLPVPEPSTALLLACGLVGLVAAQRRRLT